VRLDQNKSFCLTADVATNETEEVFAQDDWFDDHQAICTLSATAFNNSDNNNNINNNTAITTDTISL